MRDTTRNKEPDASDLDNLPWRGLPDLKALEAELSGAVIERASTFGVQYYSDDFKTPLYGGFKLYVRKPGGQRTVVELCPADINDVLEARCTDIPVHARGGVRRLGHAPEDVNRPQQEQEARRCPTA
jgi:hypothetical protein